MDRNGGTASGRIRWWLDGERSPLLGKLIEAPDRVLQGPGSVARARVGRKRFFRVAADGEGPALYVKVFALAPGWPRLRYLLRASKARREARVARRVRALGFAAVGPVAVGEERRYGLLLRSFSAIPEHPGRDLRELLPDPTLKRARRLRLLRAFAELARRLHDAGVDQDDFSPNNFLADDDDAICLIDFERCRVGRPLGKRRHALLAKLHRHDLGISRTDRLRFLGWYLGPGADRGERRRALESILSAFRRIRARDARRAAQAAFRPGRHVAQRGDAWIVVGRESAPCLRLELPAAEAREVWVRAHQLERLGLPALRPVRLGPDWVELEDPGPQGETDDAEASRARRALGAYGRFPLEPEWVFTRRGALLRDPRAFELTL
jgi:hypothetical protein